MSTLTVTFVNNTNSSNQDSDADLSRIQSIWRQLFFLFGGSTRKNNQPTVHIGFVPGSSTTKVSITNLKDNSAIKSVYDGIEKYPAPGKWYSLDELSSGVEITHFSGRIYVCYDQPWQVQRVGYEPAQAVVDPNLFLRYDKMELTYNGSPFDVANLTSIDYWSIPMKLNTLKNGNVKQTVNGLLPGVTAQNIFDALNKLTTPPVSGIPGPGGTNGTPLPALVPGSYQKDPSGPQPGTSFARIIGPSSYPPIFPPPGAIPVTPYDIWEDYLKYLLTTFGPTTQSDAVIPTLGNGVIAHIVGDFAGVGPNVPPTGPQSKQTYTLEAKIDSQLNITLSGTASGIQGPITMEYKKEALLNPDGIYGGNAPYSLNGSTPPTAPVNDVYGWVGGDLFSGFSIGSVGSNTVSDGTMIGAMPSQSWFKLDPALFFAKMQPDETHYNQWAATLSKLSEAYNFAYTDRFAHVFASLNTEEIDTLQIVLEDGTIDMN